MSDIPSQFTSTELDEWQQHLEEANRNHILCYCRGCEQEWVASRPEACRLEARALSIWLVGSFHGIEIEPLERYIGLSQGRKVGWKIA